MVTEYRNIDWKPARGYQTGRAMQPFVDPSSGLLRNRRCKTPLLPQLTLE